MLCIFSIHLASFISGHLYTFDFFLWFCLGGGHCKRVGVVVILLLFSVRGVLELLIICKESFLRNYF
jgi:hypothetical protein